jgi:UDP-glucose 4-epimerase
MKNVLVTGGTGFIGKPLIEKLISLKLNVYVLSRREIKIKGVKMITGDLLDKKSLKIPESIDTVFHLAALTNSEKKDSEAFNDFMNINFKGTVNLVDSLKNIKKFIFMSSVDALGIIQDKILTEDSKSFAKEPYDISKFKAEQYLLEKNRKENFPVVIVRPTMVYGEGDLSDFMKVNVAIFKICTMVKKHSFPIIGNGKNRLPLVHVSNVVKGTLLAEKYGVPGEIYTLSDERSYSLNELVNTIAKHLNVRFPGLHVPRFLMKGMASSFEFLEKLSGFKAPIKLSGIDYLTQNRMFDISKAKKLLHYKPIDLDEGMKITISWFKNDGYL